MYSIKNRFALLKSVILYGRELANILTKSNAEMPSREHMFLKLILIGWVETKLPQEENTQGLLYSYLFLPQKLCPQNIYGFYWGGALNCPLCFSLTFAAIATTGKCELC